MRVKINPLSWKTLKNGIEFDFLTKSGKAKFKTKPITWKMLKEGFSVKISIVVPEVTVDFRALSWKDLILGFEVDVPTEETILKSDRGKTFFFGERVTIYNDIASDGVNPRRFDRFVIDKCNIQKGILQNADGTIEKVVNAITITTKDVEHYKPLLEYRYLPADEKEKYYTVKINDVVIFGEVDDIVTTRKELDTLLAEKYKNNGFVVTAVNEYIHGMAVDNIQIIHA